MRKKRKKPEFKIVFDTNVIYSGSAHYLLCEEITEFIKNNSNYFDIKIIWLFPEIVIKERIFQMISKGYEYLPTIKKLESLLGHNLNITEEIISSRVIETVNKQIQELNIQVINLNTKNINWEQIIEDSVNRKPPFENNSKEKGFRDSLIIETFNQIIESSPKTASTCRIALFSSDNLLNIAAKNRFGNINNVRFIQDLNDLKGLINILVSEIEESIINAIAIKASELFFKPQVQETFFYSENIRNKILTDFNENLNELPDNNAYKCENGTWFIYPVNFIRKEKQKIFWRSEIEIELISYKKEYREQGILSRALSNQFPGLRKPSDLISQQGSFSPPIWHGSIFEPQKQEKILVDTEYIKGNSKFEVIWSVIYKTNKTLFNPKIEQINFIGNNWIFDNK